MSKRGPWLKRLCRQPFTPLKRPWARRLIPTSSSWNCTLASLWNIWWNENFPKGINEVSHRYYHPHTLPEHNETAAQPGGNQESGFRGRIRQLHNHLHRRAYFLISILICWCAIGQTAKPSGKPSAPVSPHCPTYVAIDQAPVSACHICAQTSVALIWPTVTDDHASGGRCRWWTSESALCVTFSLFQSSDELCGGVIIKPWHLYKPVQRLRTLCSH